jgi:hypothetical protein
MRRRPPIPALKKWFFCGPKIVSKFPPRTLWRKYNVLLYGIAAIDGGLDVDGWPRQFVTQFRFPMPRECKRDDEGCSSSPPASTRGATLISLSYHQKQERAYFPYHASTIVADGLYEHGNVDHGDDRGTATPCSLENGTWIPKPHVWESLAGLNHAPRRSASLWTMRTEETGEDDDDNDHDNMMKMRKNENEILMTLPHAEKTTTTGGLVFEDTPTTMTTSTCWEKGPGFASWESHWTRRTSI